MMVTYFLGPPCVTKYTRRYAPIMFIYFYSITHTCKRVYGDQNHDFIFNSAQVMRRRPIYVMRQKAGNWPPSWILRPFWFFLSVVTAWHSDQNFSLDP